MAYLSCCTLLSVHSQLLNIFHFARSTARSARCSYESAIPMRLISPSFICSASVRDFSARARQSSGLSTAPALQFDFAERVRVQLVAIPRGAQCSAWLLVFV